MPVDPRVNEPTESAPQCAAPLVEWEPWVSPSPAGAIDTHAHVVTTDPSFPMAANRSYTPPSASYDAYLKMLERTGMDRGVLIQISVNGTDNRFMLDGLRAHGKSGERLRAVCVVDDDAQPSELAQMHDLGVRGTRLNVLFGGGIGFAAMERIAALVAPLGWHIQLLLDIRQLPSLADRIAALPVPVVIDHMGHMDADQALGSEELEVLTRLMRESGTWVKISGPYRVDGDAPRWPAATELGRQIIETAPEQVVYGSDWPHVQPTYGMPDTGRLRNWLWDVCDHDASLVERVLVDNPERLYGFPAFVEENQ